VGRRRRNAVRSAHKAPGSRTQHSTEEAGEQRGNIDLSGVRGGKDVTERNTTGDAAVRTQGRSAALYALNGVRQRAHKDKEVRFTALLHHMTVDLLEQSFRQLERDAAAGIDEMTWQEYEEDLVWRLPELHEKVHSGKYRALPVRRTYIDKEDGRKRALGILAIEDKIVQQAVCTILNQIYETDFAKFSYGFRKGRNQHKALDALYVGITRRKINWILDADIQGFFDNINHEWLMKFLEKRIGDKRILRLISKWLKTGYIEYDERVRQEIGTPQGAVISPLLANIFLHYVFDLWVNLWRKKKARGDVIVVRFADDFVVGFQYRHEAQRFLLELKERLGIFGLKLHPEKTRLIEFGRFALDNRRKHNKGKPETFDFLGFTHICSKNRKGYFVLKRKTIRKRFKRKLRAVKEELRKRMHDKFMETASWVRSVIVGHQNYYAVPGNMKSEKEFYTQVVRMWLNILRKRSQKGKNLTWKKYKKKIERVIPRARLKHPYPNVRFDARLKVGAV
jgi:RNA-directed DNA polymerase